MPIMDVAVSIGVAGLSAVAVLIWLYFPRAASATTTRQVEEPVSFLFENDVLQQMSATAMKLHGLTPGQDRWDVFRKSLHARFPTLPEVPDDLPGPVTLEASEPDDPAVLRLTQHGRYTEVRLQEHPMSDAFETQDAMQFLENLQRASDTTPHPVWQCDEKGRVVWFNKAYDALFRKLHQESPSPDKLVFAELNDNEHPFLHKRVSVQLGQDPETDWYDISAVLSGTVTVYHAINVNAVIHSEMAQRNFIQTLAKTFAQLSIGLAIFDRKGQLALFNPALIDLTSLPADFLTARPTMMSFFDRLRENRRMPEPKNYSSWRQEITEVIAAATDGRYKETWTLETGQTYRVTGRPHPDGAIAFIIEDISAEVSLTRNFRAELELGQSLMDTFDDALAVFSSTGVLTFCNAAYRSLWNLNPDSSFADVTIHDSVQEWKRMCKAGARWSALTDTVMDYSQRNTWETAATLLNGSKLACRVSPVASGASVIRFSQVPGPKKPGPRARNKSGTAQSACSPGWPG